MTNSKYLTLRQVTELYAGIFTERLLRHLVAERRISFTKAGRRLIFDVADLETYLRTNRTESR